MRVKFIHIQFTSEAHSQLCMGVGINNIYDKYRLLWLSGTKKRTDSSGLVFRFRISVRARVRV